MRTPRDRPALAAGTLGTRTSEGVAAAACVRSVLSRRRGARGASVDARVTSADSRTAVRRAGFSLARAASRLARCSLSRRSVRSRASCWRAILRSFFSVGLAACPHEPSVPGPGRRAVACAPVRQVRSPSRRRAACDRTQGFPFRLAVIYAALDDRPRALDALEAMFASEPQRLAMFMAQPELAMLRDDPRWIALRRRLTSLRRYQSKRAPNRAIRGGTIASG